jgi:dUTPase
MEKEINYWVENKIKVNSKLPNCSANSYYQPLLNKVSTKIEFDEEFFMPKYQDKDSACADVYANCKDKRQIAISHLGALSLDCGFSIQISNGYKIRFELDSFWSNKGLILSETNCACSGNSTRIKLGLLNIGEKQIIINHKDKIAKIWIEPVYFFEWT